MSRDKSYLPEAVRDMPVFPARFNNPYANPFDESLSIKVDSITCRRCKGVKTDPDGEYDCLLCHGSGEEESPAKWFCSAHPDTELVMIGTRYVEWEDGQGFDNNGHLEVKGCPICKVPAHSETTIA